MDFDAVRSALTRRQAELRGRSERVSADLRHERDPLSADFADQAIQRANDEVLGAIGQSAKLELQQIGAALQRLQKGLYSVCAACGGPIADARLHALPHTDRCASCAVQDV